MTKTYNTSILSNSIVGAGLVLALFALSMPFFANAAIIDRQLEVGSTGSDVSAMQTFFAKDVTIYPQGLVTGYFGFLTKSAVSNFQSRNGLPPVGRVGPMTLPVLNLQMAQGSYSGLDVRAPAIIRASIIDKKSTSAEFRWSTNESARGKLFYSTSPITMSNTFEQTGMYSVEPTVSAKLADYDGVARVTHTVNITGLRADTTYYYMIEALDSSNNVSITTPASFHTSN